MGRLRSLVGVVGRGSWRLSLACGLWVVRMGAGRWVLVVCVRALAWPWRRGAPAVVGRFGPGVRRRAPRSYVVCPGVPPGGRVAVCAPRTRGVVRWCWAVPTLGRRAVGVNPGVRSVLRAGWWLLCAGIAGAAWRQWASSGAARGVCARRGLASALARVVGV